MNSIPSEQLPNSNDELLTEYRFDYRKAKPNRFTAPSDKKVKRSNSNDRY